MLITKKCRLSTFFFSFIYTLCVKCVLSNFQKASEFILARLLAGEGGGGKKAACVDPASYKITLPPSLTAGQNELFQRVQRRIISQQQSFSKIFFLLL